MLPTRQEYFEATFHMPAISLLQCVFCWPVHVVDMPHLVTACLPQCIMLCVQV